MADRSKYTNIFFSLALVGVAVICYILLIVLFLNAITLRLNSLVHVSDPSYITPLVVVGLLAAVLGSATVAFTTRCAEHSLWLKLAPGNVKRPLTVGESRRLAQWSVSPLERIKYLFRGQSAPLRISGILLIATTTAVGPVLLAGISQGDLVDATSTFQAHAVDVWTPWITRSNYRSRQGSANDIPVFAAALASNDNLTLPVAPVCLNGTSSTSNCSITTRSAALFAMCTPRTLPNTDKMASTVCSTGSSTSGPQYRNYCSTIVPSMCVNLTCGAPAVFANFRTGPDLSCALSSEGSTPSQCNTIPGTWATILGVWVGGMDLGIGDTKTINLVDCAIQYGNATLSQTGSSPPTLDRSSFMVSTHLLSEYSSPISGVRTFAWRENAARTPYYFTLRYVGTGFNDIYASPVASGLLGDDASNSAEHVARQIERNFDWATLAAFSKGVNASDVTTTRTTVTRVYVYDRRVLSILLIPVIATVMSAWGRLRVGSDEVVRGYDPVAIAQLGPVEGMPLGGEVQIEKGEVERTLRTLDLWDCLA
ncbi:hypothetical protein B0T18DRAFT_389712 [Schizothecium vesticola]|uniref:Transmembrane protein n=1 Tax=Schizothecium vesticola TaxID=314040 RepID=A0AA40F302_9PEZI|nr:hypothetical protein B0T18DRAFT_389712 [Schizothecium vesticola]